MLLFSVPAYADVTFGLLLPDDKGGGKTSTPPPSLEDVAGPSAEVTLPDLLALTVRQAPSLQLARIDIEIAEAQMEQARGVLDWGVAAEAEVHRNESTQFISALGDYSRARTTGGSLTGDLTKLFPWGGRVALHAGTGFDRSTGVDFSGMPVENDEWTDTITATWTEPLLEGRGRNIVLAEQARAKVARDSAALARQQAAIAVIRDVVDAYWELVFAQRDLEIRISSLDLANERLRRTQAGIKGGGLARTEALEVEQVVATREEEVLGAQLTVLERSIAVRRLVGMEIGPSNLGLTTETDLGVPDQKWDLDSLVDEAYRTSPELALLREQGESAEIEVEVTENGVLPSLDLSVTGGPTGVDNTALDAAVGMAKFDNYGVGVTLTFEHSIGNHGATGAARAARAERLKVKINETDARAQIAQALAEAVVLAESAARRVEIAGRAIDLAEQNIVAEQSRYGLGKSTNFDVLQRQDELKQAQLRQARAIIDWHKAKAIIASISGSLLGDYGIDLGE